MYLRLCKYQIDCVPDDCVTGIVRGVSEEYQTRAAAAGRPKDSGSSPRQLSWQVAAASTVPATARPDNVDNSV